MAAYVLCASMDAPLPATDICGILGHDCFPEIVDHLDLAASEVAMVLASPGRIRVMWGKSLGTGRPRASDGGSWNAALTEAGNIIRALRYAISHAPESHYTLLACCQRVSADARDTCLGTDDVDHTTLGAVREVALGALRRADDAVQKIVGESILGPVDDARRAAMAASAATMIRGFADLIADVGG